LFFFEQFSTIIFVSFQFLLIIVLIYYRTCFSSGATEQNAFEEQPVT
jgi:hypothetical protein